MRISILGVGFDNITMDQAISACLDLMKKGGYVATPNPEIVWLCRKDQQALSCINSADLVVADGIGIIYAGRILKKPFQSRIPGMDLATNLISKLAETGGSVFLFGAKPGVAEKAAENLIARHPGLTVAGTADGYFQDPKPIIQKICDTKPDFLLVCLGAPKQEIFMHTHQGDLPPCLMMGLGGVLDGYAGNAKRAPKSWRKLGLEWLYRLILQPSRIKRMIKLPAFLVLIVMQRLKEIGKKR